jgi:hypothetical protein
MYIQITDGELTAWGAYKFDGYTKFVAVDYEDYTQNPNKYIFDGADIVVNPNYEKEQKEKEEELFNASFFKTSLGYVRRSVTMKTGAVKDFLADILPVLEVGVPILTYTSDLEQKKVAVTEQFLAECKAQILTDFYGD